MIVISTMVRDIRVPREFYELSLRETVKQQLIEMLKNKVVINVGLCIDLFDIINIEESFLVPGDEASHTRVTFRFIVFRALIGEILTGKIKRCTEEGVHVSLDLFDDMHFDTLHQTTLPCLQLGGSHLYLEVQRGRWMDIDHKVRFRVVAAYFHEPPPEEVVHGQETAYKLTVSIDN